MSDDTVTIEVDGRTFEACKGSMLIEATDAAGIYVPRFCYHKHLSVAANCRMCLVEVERSPKPLAACATPVMDGMKVFTRSQGAIDAQRSTMEFLLINHPLDCPICDQGGECELQDLAMGYGGDVSRYSEAKRVVRDKDIGPLVQTDMTRCIHCTRCVRFGEEIAGLRELGATGRGEYMEIGTYVEHAMTSELSGNVIDLCPVGALTSKPYRYSARAWELQQHDGIAPHDAIGSNIHYHVKGSTLKRVVPKDNPGVNETWISDRDRFSYEAINSDERLLYPRIKRNGTWRDCDWETALETVCERFSGIAETAGGDQIGALASPSSTVEEFYLLQRMIRGLGSHNIDHRLRQCDFGADREEPRCPNLGIPLHAVEAADAIVLIGSYPRWEQPLLNHRIKKAAANGAKVALIHSIDYEFNFELETRLIVRPSELPRTLGGIAKAVIGDGVDQHREALASIDSGDGERQVAAMLASAKVPLVILGNFAHRHADYAQIKALAGAICAATDAHLGQVTDGANSSGGWFAGAVPHRGPGGRELQANGLDCAAMLDKPLRGYLLLGVEPDLDLGRSRKGMHALGDADFVVALGVFSHPALDAVADVILPIASFAENEGTFVNCTGQWQTFEGAVRPPAEARPAWKIFRLLGERLGLPGFEAVDCAGITAEVRALNDDLDLTSAALENRNIDAPGAASAAIDAIIEVPMYSVDAFCRRGAALQSMIQSGDDRVYLNANTLKKLGLNAGANAQLANDGSKYILATVLDERIPDDSFMIYGARGATTTLDDEATIVGAG